MKLSEELIELAEYWISNSKPIADAFKANSHMCDLYGFEKYTMYTMRAGYNIRHAAVAYLCLLEAELQKDIECLNEMLAVVHG